MIPPIKMPNLHIVRPERVKTFRFTLVDDTVVRKKLIEHIAAKDDKPKINIFDDDTFTVGEEPIVYKRQGEDWIQVFQFKAVHVEMEDQDEE